MREGSSLYDKMLDGNWVLKRKRKQILPALDENTGKEGDMLLSEFTRKSSSLRKKLKGNADGLKFPQKTKGHDGYHFECEQCDLGGNLLCCDNCPRTYHLECLDPPLKRAPAGRWLCPKCYNKRVDRTLKDTRISSSRARTRTNSNAMALQNIFSSDKSTHSERSFQRNSKSTTEEEVSPIEKSSNSLHADSSTDVRSSLPIDNLLKDGVSTTTVHKMKKKAVLSSCREKNAQQTVLSLVKPLNSHPSDRATKKKPNLCENGSQRKKLIIPLVVPSQISEKSMRKINKIYKRKSSEHHSAESNLKQETNLLNSLRLNEYEVHRILGCRVHTETSCIIHTIGLNTSTQENKAENARLQTEFPSCDFTSQENLDQGCFDVSKVVDVNFRHVVDKEDAYSVAQRIVGSSIVLGKNTKDNACGTGKTIDKPEGMLRLMSQPSQDHFIVYKELQFGNDSAGDANVGELIAKKFVVESTHVELLSAENHTEHHLFSSAELPVSCVSQDAHIAIRHKSDGSYEDSVVSKALAQELTPKDGGSPTYDFFVKWAGKSNLHNSWVSEDQLKVLAKKKLENYKAKYGLAIINICDEQWCQPQRIISIHESDNGGEEALVKWIGLPYDECTWERLDEPVIKNSSHLLSELKHFESQASDKDYSVDIVRTDIREVSPLLEQPKELKGGSLFPHQLEALNWLRKCWHKSKNVILADEMGLGKTVSACSFISSLYFEFKVKLPCLVLVPLSTIPNWLAEFVSWAPHLNVVEYHGSAKARSLIRKYEWHASEAKRPSNLSKAYKFNVLLTTYEMILTDSSHLRGVPWEVLIVDEGHRLKNSESKLFNLLNTFSFQQRVLLTGTPLQNNLGEMYNLLNFLQPHSFLSLSSFEQKFSDLSTAEKVEELKKLVAPHMLRRLKRDAMQNIPPKTERMVPVELTSIQAEYYRAMLTKNYQILRNIGKGVAQQSMLNIVMQLRKVCNHPYLIPGTDPESGSIEFLQEMRIKASAKLTLLHSMLKILRKDGHRILIFSQMTKLLDILEDYMAVEFGLGTFERVDGTVSVAGRQAAIARFNQDKTCFVFLLSTRSCGLGINLASADTVIIYDSDFNPHADIQAMNRAHRIGQSKRLLVYRLVVRATVEERILQLAKKKLMLDQLFVSKSGSQKEVEDILRWGTEELFSDFGGENYLDVKNGYNYNVDATAYGENKHRRRTGGLGNVYEDRFTLRGIRFAWDETAVLKLLDRSNLQLSISDNNDMDLDNDMLGSVKSLDWNEVSIFEEPGNIEILTNLAGDGHEPSPDAKEDNTNTLMEQNEWDKLLRVRWEKHQVEEDTALGRGKRLRKAISYKETITSVPNEALNESGNEEDEPKREYTPAGQALKEKFLKIRARQKERIAKRHIRETHPSVQRPKLSFVRGPQSNDSKSKGDLSVNPEEATSCSQPPGSKNEKVSKNYMDLSVTPEIFSAVNVPRNRVQKTSPSASVNFSNLSPVLGLCAPNASHRYASLTFRTTSKKRSTIGLPKFPSSAAEISRGADQSTLPDASQEAVNPRLKNIIPENYFPFSPPPRPTSGRGLLGLGENLGATCSSLHEKLGLPEVDLDDGLKFIFPFVSQVRQQTHLFPSISSGANMELANGYSPDLSNIRLVPDFPPLPGLSTMHTSQQLSDNHKKVLDNIVMRTRTSAEKFWKTRPKTDAWSEDELDALWIGVRRHGRGNWDAMYRDPNLKILKHKSIQELSSKWNKEQCKIIDGPSPFPEIPKFSSGLSGGMLAQTLSGIGQDPSRFHSHLTDIRLACGDFFPKFPFLERPDQPHDKFGSSCIEDLSAGMLSSLEKFTSPSGESLAGNFFGAPGMVSSDDNGVTGSSRAGKLPHWLQKAVGGPPNPTESVPSPSVSAILHSVRVLYGEDEFKIPPFVMPGPPPFLPEDPRKNPRKKRKLDRNLRALAGDSCSESVRTEPSIYSASTVPVFPSRAQSSDPPSERKLAPPLSPLNLNLNYPSQSWEVPVLQTFPESRCSESSRQSEGDLVKRLDFDSGKAEAVPVVSSEGADSSSSRSGSQVGIDVKQV